PDEEEKPHQQFCAFSVHSDDNNPEHTSHLQNRNQ
ncbi:MAG: hypothetical protein ACI9NC_006313, partial [Verrucomicrobiales bacterium]